MSHPGPALVGVDTGGTFTDTVVVLPDGRLGVGKALSTPGRFEQGVLDSMTAAAASLGLTLSELLQRTAILTHGTTVGINALLTGSGSRVGLLTTAGFESTLPIARANKIHGLDELDSTVPTRWRKPDQLLTRRAIAGVVERIDVTGSVVRPLDEDQARRAIRRLAALGVEAVSISLLWSPMNPAHEQRLAEIVAEELPGVHVSCSAAIAPVIGEYERTSTVVIDAYIAPAVASYLDALRKRLNELGFPGVLMILRSGGGAQPVEYTLRAPVSTLRSGPVAGLAATARLAQSLGHANAIATDVGGTSFDVGLVVAGEMQRAERPMVHRHALATPVLEVESIGTGGGSIAWLDRGLGALRVGPRSAGADPGPACYGRGGTSPTLTDAAVALGYIRRLGGGVKVDVAAARAAIAREIAKPLGISVEAAAEGIIRVATDRMRDLIRRRTIQRGYDPSKFLVVAFGGAGPQYACWYTDGLGAIDVVIPYLASEFSAYGAASSELSVYAERDLVPTPITEAAMVVQETLHDLEGHLRANLSTEVEAVASVSGSGLHVSRQVGVRFYRQQRHLDMPIDVPVDADGLRRVETNFRRRYDEIIGASAATADTPLEVVSVTVRLTVDVATPSRPLDQPGSSAPTGERVSWFNGTRYRCAVYSWSSLRTDHHVSGPAFIESPQTTVVVPPTHCAVVDIYGHLHLCGA